MILKINIQILNKLVESNDLSAFRFLVFISNKFNNHLHKSDYSIIRKELQISNKVIAKNISRLISLNIIDKISDNYFRVKSWRTYSYSKKNRIIDISIENLRDLSYLRTLYYYVKYRSSFYCAKKNRKLAKRQKSLSVPVSATFVQMVTGVGVTTSTLYKHLKRSESLGLIEVQRSYSTLICSTNLQMLRQARKYVENSTIIQASNTFKLISFNPNQISLIRF